MEAGAQIRTLLSAQIPVRRKVGTEFVRSIGRRVADRDVGKGGQAGRDGPQELLVNLTGLLFAECFGQTRFDETRSWCFGEKQKFVHKIKVQFGASF